VEIRKQKGDEVSQPVAVLNNWIRTLASCVCEFFGLVKSETKRYSWIIPHNTSKFYFLGRKTDTSIAALAFTLLFNQIQRLSEVQNHNARLSYIEGLIQALWGQVEQRKKDKEEESSSRDLAVSHDKAAEEAQTAIGIGKIVYRRIKRRKNVDEDARKRGRIDGKEKLDINAAAHTLQDK